MCSLIYTHKKKLLEYNPPTMKYSQDITTIRTLRTLIINFLEETIKIWYHESVLKRQEM